MKSQLTVEDVLQCEYQIAPTIVHFDFGRGLFSLASPSVANNTFGFANVGLVFVARDLSMGIAGAYICLIKVSLRILAIGCRLVCLVDVFIVARAILGHRWRNVGLLNAKG